jgi:hypothetical protein
MTHSRFRAVPLSRLSVVALAALIIPAHAGTYANDFSSDPFSTSLPANQRLTTFSNQAVGNANRPSWVANGGVSNSGYLKLTDAVGSIRSTIVFPDFEPGFKVAGFSFGVDCRIGGGGATPADGFSINFARKDEITTDTVITTGTPYAGANNVGHTEADRHEEGTRTGLGIGFDSYFSGGEDVIGISVRVDDQLLAQIPAATLNGLVTNAASLQTGPLITGTAAEKVAALGWARFEVDLDPGTGRLDIWWKGVKVVDQLETNFIPSAGRLVFGARTGGQNQVHHFDNIELETFPVELAAVTSARVGHDGFVFTVNDFGSKSIVTPADIETVEIDGVPVAPTSVNKSNGVTTITYVPQVPFPPHKAISYLISAYDQNDEFVGQSATLTTPILPQSFFIADTPTLNQWNIREIRGGTVVGTPPIDSALTIAATPPGTPTDYLAPYFNISDEIDFGGRGFFKRDTLYATNVTGGDDNMVGLGRTKIQVTEAGDYTFRVHSDDGFALRVNGASFSKVAGLGLIDGSESSTIAFLNGTGNSDTRGTVNLPVGEHVIDFLWFEGTGTSYAEVSWAKGDHADIVADGKWSLVGGAGETPFFPAAPLDIPAPTGGNWSVRNYHGGGNVPTLRSAFELVANPGAAVLTDASSPVVNFRDPQNAGADGIFRNNIPFPMEVTVPGVDDNQFVTVGRYEFVAAAAGDYSFAVTADDGFAFRMLGGPHLINGAGPANNNSGIDPIDSTAFLNTNANDEVSYGVYRVAAPGTYTVEVVQVEQSGGASLEVAWAQGNHNTRNTTSAWRLLGNDADASLPIAAPILPDNLFDALPPAPATYWSTRFFYPGTTVGNLQTAFTVMQNSATPFQSGVYQFLNFRNFLPDGQVEGAWVSGLFHATNANAVYQVPAERQFLGATDRVDNVAVMATSRIVIPTSGVYTFGISSDDGFALRILNAPNGFQRVTGTATIDTAQTNTVYRLTGSNNARAVINLPAGEYDLEFAYFEGTGEAHFEVYAVAGDFSNDADSGNWRIIGHTASGGLGLAAQPVAPTLPMSLRNVSVSAGAFSFSWNSQDGANYHVQYSADLITWHDLDPDFGAQAGGVTTFTGNIADLTLIPQTDKVFFRLVD